MKDACSHAEVCFLFSIDQPHMKAATFVIPPRSREENIFHYAARYHLYFSYALIGSFRLTPTTRVHFIARSPYACLSDDTSPVINDIVGRRVFARQHATATSAIYFLTRRDSRSPIDFDIIFAMPSPKASRAPALFNILVVAIYTSHIRR